MTETIHGKIFAIQEALPRLAKDGEFDAGSHQYKFLAVDDVIKAVRPLMNKEGVYLTTQLVDKTIDHNRAELSGARVPKQSTHVTVTYDFIFTAAEDGSKVVSRVIGEGYDSQDKAIRKATTSAQKIAFINTFFIETGEPDLHDGFNGAAENEKEEASKQPSAAERRVERAKAEPPKQTKAPSSAASKPSEARAVQTQIREEFIDTGKKTAEDVNALVAEVQAETGAKNRTKAVFVKVLEELRKQDAA